MMRATLLGTLLCLSTAALAVVPGQVNHQGLLLDDQGSPITGNVDLVFSLFDVESGGSAIWTEAHNAVPVLDGVYDVQLGGTTPITPALVSGGSVYLEISVDGETLSPRQRLLPVPFALRAVTAEDVGGVSATYVTQVFEDFAFDGADPPNQDPSEGLADTDLDGIANFIDPDNDDDGIPDGDEVAAGSDINLVTPTITAIVNPGPVEASVTNTVTVEGTNFVSGMSVVFGSQSPTPQNVTPTSFELDVGPQPAGNVSVTVTRPNGESANAGYLFVENQPVIASFDPPWADTTSTTVITVTGSGFAPGLDVVFGSESPAPTNLTATSFQVSVGPQAPGGTVSVVASYPSGKQDSASYELFDPSNPKKVFVTSSNFSPIFGGYPAGVVHCNNAAGAAGLTGTFAPWISDDTHSPATDFSKIGNFGRTDGTLVANDWNDLTDGTLLAAIDHDEFGNPVSADVWTGTNADGTPTGEDCLNWSTSSASSDATTGRSTESDADWSSIGVTSCAQLKRLYCVEQ